MASYDLHVHTCWSYDAVASVDYYFRTARELRLRCIAVADHHNIDSLPEVLAVSAQYPEVSFVRAAELTVTTAAGASVDMVCLGLPRTAPPALQRVLDDYHRWQREYGAAVSAGLQALGYEYSDERRLELLRTYRPAKAIAVQGATHVQNGVQKRYFVQRGFMANEEQYGEILRRAGEVVARPPYPAASTVIPAVHQAGGLAVIAHPTGYFARDDRRRMDALREELGLDGIECAHDSVPPELSPVYRAYCEEHGLVSTGGSDCHADPADNPHRIGVQHAFSRHAGADVWLDEVLERLNTSG